MTFDYKKYWEQRYQGGGNSGNGSYGDNASFKANIINNFCKERKLRTAVEIGCGDGNNLGLYNFEEYVGLDISPKAIDLCKEKYRLDDKKIFAVYTGEELPQYDVSLCLDVTYHIMDRHERENVINHAIGLGDYAIFYSFLEPEGHAQHINSFKILDYLEKLLSRKLISSYRVLGDTPPDSQSRFIIVREKGKI